MGNTNQPQSNQTFNFQENQYQAPQAPPYKQHQFIFQDNNNKKTPKSDDSNQQTAKNDAEKKEIEEISSKKIQSDKKKEIGNQLFQEKNFKKSIQAYTDAINIYSSESIYYSNRASAYKAIGNIQESLKDCERALQYDPSNSRSLCLIGVNLVLNARNTKQKDLDELTIKNLMTGIKYLEQANKVLQSNEELSKIKLKTQVQSNLGKSKRILFLQARYLDEQNCLALEQIMNEILYRAKSDLDIKGLRKIMNQNMLQDTEVPDQFNCIITQEIMRDPMITLSGHSYEKDALVQQFKTNGFKDPCTRETIDPQRVYYNQNLKMGIVEFKCRYGWLGVESSDEQDYNNIQLE